MASFKSMNDVKNHLERLNSLSDLKPEDYALEGGIADKIAQQSGEMKFTQLRKFFGHIKKIEREEKKGKGRIDSDSFDLTKLYLLMPELVYAYGRQLITKDFYDVMKICLGPDKIKEVADFKRLVELLTAVIAYHKKKEADTKRGGGK